MKLYDWIMKLVVLLLALPVFILLIFEGACLVITDGIPGLLKKLSLSPTRIGN